MPESAEDAGSLASVVGLGSRITVDQLAFERSIDQDSELPGGGGTARSVDWVESDVYFARPLGYGGQYKGSFQHKDYALSSHLSFSPVAPRVRPVGLLGAEWVRSHYFIWDPGSSGRRRREEHVAAPALLVGLELPVNPDQRVTVTARVHARFVAWLPEVNDDGLRAVSLILGVGVQFRLR